ncbi:SURF1 family protein [Collimonas sp.]|jgi:surfeit locus 1 family protein|uniref:SURF1 family protein n=1 Tax=Collimonas sp. TaxID=1963772 RepID=UPI0037BFC4B0
MNQAPHSKVAGDGLPDYTAVAARDVKPQRRANAARLMLAVCAGLMFFGFVALGSWQLKRLQWKLDLIERVEQRVHAPAIAAPDRQNWPQINAQNDEYRHIRLTGNFLYQLTTPVQAVTELGNGFWLLTPLRSADGSVVLVNRGFVAAKVGDWKSQDSASQDSAVVQSASSETVSVTGLLRLSEPGGGFLRRNDPQANHWYSRDVQAIAAARGLSAAAPYFVDADAGQSGSGGAATGQPIGGLTVVSFHNSHLVYALTWYALALMVAGACFWVVREERRTVHRTDITGASSDGIDRESDDGKQN